MSLCFKRKERRGVAIVETALVVPLIFTLLFACIEFGRVMMATHGIEEAAREGCRALILDGATPADVQQIVADRLGSFGISGYKLTTDPAQLDSLEQWDPVTVSISVPYSGVSWLPTPQYMSGIVLNSSCTLSMESEQ